MSKIPNSTNLTFSIFPTATLPSPECWCDLWCPALFPATPWKTSSPPARTMLALTMPLPDPHAPEQHRRESAARRRHRSRSKSEDGKGSRSHLRSRWAGASRPRRELHTRLLQHDDSLSVSGNVSQTKRSTHVRREAASRLHQRANQQLEGVAETRRE